MATTGQVKVALSVANTAIDNAMQHYIQGQRALREAIGMQVAIKAETGNELGIPQLMAATDSVVEAITLCRSAIDENTEYMRDL